jgi:glycosyltransferase involved in cell wall biosynthesis
MIENKNIKNSDNTIATYPLSGEKINVIAFLNSYTKGLSGGVVRFVEVMKRLNKKSFVDLTIVTSLSGKNLCLERGLNAVFKLTTQEREAGNVVLMYIGRIVTVFSLRLELNASTVLYSTSDFLPDVLPALIWKLKSRNKKCKWVQTIFHLIPPPLQREGSFTTNLISFSAQRLSFYLIRPSADLIFVLNNTVRDQLIKLGFSKNRLFVTGAGIGLSQIDEIQRAEGMDYDACFLGRLHSSKGIFDLIEIWKLVVSKKKSAKLAIIYIGPKDLELAMMRRIKEENLDSNVFMLQLTGNDALSVVKSSKVFIFPSHEEGWGIAICEAMACGLPVIAWNLPVYGEIFPQGMITVRFGNFKRFAEMTLKLLDNSELRQSMGRDALNIASQYSWDKVAGREMALIESLNPQKRFSTTFVED